MAATPSPLDAPPGLAVALAATVMAGAVAACGPGGTVETGAGFAADPAASRTLGPATPDPRRPLPDDARAWVERRLEELDTRERAGQLVFPWITGAFTAPASPAFDSLAALVRQVGIGGVVVSVGTPLSMAAKLNALQRRAPVPLLVTSDFESGGPGMRMGGIYALPSLIPVGGGTEFPPTMAFGAAGEDRFAEALGRITAEEARAVGVHVTLAPVVDVNTNPENPVINTRSFGERPAEVARLGAAFVRGARAGGLLTTVKHFPGHGDTREDSHVDLPTVAADRARLDSVELVPFRHVLEAGADAVLTAHIIYPLITGPDGPPATLSSYFLTRVLRQEWGFRGLVIADALDMAAIAGRYGTGGAAVRAVVAGADVLLMPTDPRAAVDSLVAAVADGRLPGARLEEAAHRVLVAKARAGLHRGRLVPLEAVDRRVGTGAHQAAADTVAVRALTLPRDRRGLVPLDTARVRSVLSVTLAREADVVAGRTFDAVLRDALPRVRSARLEPGDVESRYDTLLRDAREADAAILSVYVPPASGAGSVAVPEAFAAFAAELSAGETPSVLATFGNPYVLSEIPAAGSYLVAWGGGPRTQRGAALGLLGRAALRGRLPVSIPALHRTGDGLVRRPYPFPHRTVAAGDSAAAAPRTDPEPSASRDATEGAVTGGVAGLAEAGLARVDSLVRAAVADSVTPGAAVAVGRHGRLYRLRGYGRLDYSPDSPAVTDSSLYDLASLTKVVGTTTAIMELVEEGRVRLDAPVASYLPWWGGAGKNAVTVRQLLLHRGGLPPFRPWWQEIRGRDAYRQALAALPPAYPPGDSTVYSDLGFITLGFLVEEVAGTALDRYLERHVFGPLGMRETGFRPALLPGPGPDTADHVAAGDTPAVPAGPVRDTLTPGAGAVADTALLARIAPTEVDTVFRHTHVRGVVHDENAYALGGVAGHAGLFSTARDLARFAQLLLDRGWVGVEAHPPEPPSRSEAVGGDARFPAGGPEGDAGGSAGGAPREPAPPEAWLFGGTRLVRLLEAGTVVRFTARQDRASTRALGWDTPGPAPSSGAPFGERAFGHTGFTGTSLWVDPERDLFVVLLTNRVNPTREEGRHVKLRLAVHRAVVAAARDAGSAAAAGGSDGLPDAAERATAPGAGGGR